jgi:hypothetical protein
LYSSTSALASVSLTALPNGATRSRHLRVIYASAPQSYDRALIEHQK